MSRLQRFREWSLAIAEGIDAYRIVPRTILLAYGWLVWRLSTWYMSIPSANKTSCDNGVLSTLLSEGINLEQARLLACTIVETVGGPTPEQTMFVSIIVGLSSAVIGLYLSTGKTSKWQGDVLRSVQSGQPTPVTTHPSYGQPQYGQPRSPYREPPHYHGQPYYPPVAGDGTTPTTTRAPGGAPPTPVEFVTESDETITR